jgi:hypothetical protein
MPLGNEQDVRLPREVRITFFAIPGVLKLPQQQGWIIDPEIHSVPVAQLRIIRSRARHKRPDDKLGLAVGYAHVSKRAQQLDLDFQRLVLPSWPLRSFEGLVTAVYSIRFATDGPPSRIFNTSSTRGAAPRFRSARRPASISRMPRFSA